MLLAACGGNSSTTSTVPQSPDPNTGGNIPTPGTGNDPRLPDLTNAKNVTLFDRTTLSGLNEMLATDGKRLVCGNDSDISSCLVGDPKIILNYPDLSNLDLKGSSMTFVFEDQGNQTSRGGLWVIKMNAVNADGASIGTSSSNDAIFTDDLMTIRIVSSPSNGYGDIYYRIRQAGENQCKRIYCRKNPNPSSPDYNTAVECTSLGFADPNPQMVSTCRNDYMVPNNGFVKRLGYF